MELFCLGGLMMLMILLGLAAERWGVDSRDGVDSPEWERRQNWPGFH